MSQMTPSALHSHQYIRGASQQQQPHKSNSSGGVKPLTPLLARKKRMPSLASSPVLVHTGVWDSRINVTQSYATQAVLWSSTTRLCFSTEAFIICISACHTGNSHYATDVYQSHKMKSDVRHTSIYKFVLGLNETGGTLFLVPYVQYRREVLAYPVDLQVRLDDHHLLPCLGCTTQSRHQ